MANAGPPRLDLWTAGHVLCRSWSLLLAALLLLSFRSALLASVADRDPAVSSLLSRLSSAAAGSPPRPPPCRRPFLHLPRVGTLDEDFFSDSTAGDCRAFRQPAASSNISFPTLVPLFLVDGSLGFPRSPKSVKIRVPDFPFSPFVFSFPDGEGGADDAAGDRDQAGDLRVFGRGLNLDRQDVMVILYLLTLLSSTHSLRVHPLLYLRPRCCLRRRHHFPPPEAGLHHRNHLFRRSIGGPATHGVCVFPVGCEGRRGPVPLHVVLRRRRGPERAFQALCEGQTHAFLPITVEPMVRAP